MPIETTSNADLASQILGLIGQDTATAEVFRRCTRDQLLEIARRLGLTGVSKLAKEALAGRVLGAYEDLVRQENTAQGEPDVDAADGQDEATTGGVAEIGKAAAFHKFDLGP